MQSKEKENIIFIRLFSDENIHEKLKEVCKKHEVKTGIIISGIGQLKNVKLGYYKEKGDYTPEEISKPVEILSLTGNICKEKDEYLFHLHAVLGNEKKNAIGGHLIEGIVGILAEIVIQKTNLDIKRKLDKITGLKTIDLK